MTSDVVVRKTAKVRNETLRQHESRIALYTQRFDASYKPVVPPPTVRLERLRAW